MITRKQYLENPKLHHQYYLEIAKKAGIKPYDSIVERSRLALKNGDEHLNTIPLNVWDSWATSIMGFNGNMLRKIFKEKKDTMTLSGMVCMLKVVVKHTVETLKT